MAHTKAVNGQFDIREDEEQGVKQQEIIDLLLAAGYFRARIKGLSAFDKVVGGMVWCMQSCHFDVDVDLLFQENSSIGQKIALTEKIVRVLPKMECPHRIEPHQIQGLDFIHIFPVIQWLVRRSVTVREEQSEFIRAHALRQFEHSYTPETGDNRADGNVRLVQEEFRPRRVRRRTDALPDDEHLQVESTLFEYGLSGTDTADKDVFSGQDKSVFADTREHEENISSSMIGNIVSSQVEKIAQASRQFAELEVNLKESDNTLLMSQKEAMERESEQLETDVQSLTGEIEQVRRSVRELEDDVVDSGADNNYASYKKLQSLLALESCLKQQEQEFREQCRVELERLQQMIEEAEARESPGEANSTDRQYESEKKQIKSLRLQIAKRNRAIALMQRQLDEIPGRGELAQYQRRFLELYGQVGQKHQETKQFYTMYNTLDDIKQYMGKELSLLNSVLDNYSGVMSNNADKEEFIKQFDAIVLAVKQNKEKIKRRKSEAKNRRDLLSKQLLELVEQQRNYVSIVRQLKIECKKNEELLAYYRSIHS